MALVPLFGLGLKGKSAVVTAQRHLNLYCEINAQGDKTSVTFYGTPGLILVTSFGDTPIRGYLVVGDFVYVVHRGTLWQLNNAGVKISLGTLNTASGRVSMAYNGLQIGITDGPNLYVLTIATLAFVVVTTNLIGVPIDITFGDSYGILTYANGQFQITSSYDFTTLDALDFATAESNPDGLVRGIYDHGELLLFGSNTIEPWGNTGGQDFPYSVQRGSTLQFGLAAKWSLVQYNDSIAGLFKNSMGQVQVMQMKGHAIVPISSQELDSVINSYGTVGDATAFCYLLGGHPFLQINFPTAQKSWLYDASTQLWSEIESGLSGGRHRAEILVDYLNKPRVTDYENGNIYTLDADTYTDNGMPIAREIVTKTFFAGANKRIAVSRVGVDCETGNGLATGQGDNPQIMMQVSKDSGRTWGNEIFRSMGKIGVYVQRVYWTRLGAAYFWTLKFRVTDPVKVVLTFTDAESEVRN